MTAPIPPPTSGAFVALEGGEGCGKSTQALLLASALDAVATREPGGTPAGAAIRSLVLDAEHTLDDRAEALLMAADRAQHMAEVVRPALARGRWVVSDRSAFSSLAYQGYGRGLPLEELERLCDWATGGVWPDLVVLVDVPRAVAAARIGAARDRMEAAGSEFHERVAQGFRALAERDPARWLVVDGERSVEDVHGEVLARIREWAAAHA